MKNKKQWAYDVHTILLFFVFIALPFFDALNGYLIGAKIISESGVASPSQLGRAIALIFMLYIIYIKRLNVIPIFIVLTYLVIIEIVSALYHESQYGFIYGVISLYKIGYLFLLIIVLSSFLKTKSNIFQLSGFLKWNLIIIASFLYVSTFTGMGNSTYGFGFGTKSYFSSGNGLGLYIGVGTFLLIGLKSYKFTEVSNKLLLYIVISISLIGSKTALVLCLSNLLLLVFISKYRSLLVIMSVVIISLLLPKIVESLSVVFDVVLGRLKNSDDIITFLSSGRTDFVINAFYEYFSFEPSSFRILFGMGAFTSFQNPAFVVAYDTLETDVFDLLFMYGLFSVLAYFCFLGYALFMLRMHKILMLGLFLLILHSVMAGHVIFNGMSSTCIVLFVCMGTYLSRNNNKTVLM